MIHLYGYVWKNSIRFPYNRHYNENRNKENEDKNKKETSVKYVRKSGLNNCKIPLS